MQRHAKLCAAAGTVLTCGWVGKLLGEAWRPDSGATSPALDRLAGASPAAHSSAPEGPPSAPGGQPPCAGCATGEFICARDSGDAFDRSQKDAELCECEGAVRYGRDTLWSSWLLVVGAVKCASQVFPDAVKQGDEVCICNPSGVPGAPDFGRVVVPRPPAPPARVFVVPPPPSATAGPQPPPQPASRPAGEDGPDGDEPAGRPSAASGFVAPSSGGRKVTAFFHVFSIGGDHGGTKLTYKIFNQQVANLTKLREAGKLQDVFYHTIGPSLRGNHLSCEWCQRIAHHDKGSEVHTLQSLYDYCVDHQHENVMYLHTKGSFHPGSSNHKFRKFLMLGILSDSCLQMPDACSACASRFSPLPHHHMPGNMFVARCEHIARLLPPSKFADAMSGAVEFLASIATHLTHEKAAPEVAVPMLSLRNSEAPGESAALGTGRFALEHWLLSHPSSVPCDLYPGDYYFGYENIPETMTWRPVMTVGSRFALKDFDIHNDVPFHNLELWRITEWSFLYGAASLDALAGWARRAYRLSNYGISSSLLEIRNGQVTRCKRCPP